MGQRAGEEIAAGEEACVGGGRVLVVDDDALLRSSIRRILADEGYRVDVARDGRDALTRVERAVPDLILLDVLMPGMNGRQVLETLRRDATTRGIPIVIMSAFQGVDATAGLSAGSVDYVEKPFDIEELLNKVALALYRARGARAPEEAPPFSPRATPDAARTSPAASEAAIAPAAAPATDTILVVDDDRSLLASLDRALSARGCTLVSTPSASDDLPRLARVLEPRAILIALQVPGAGGMAALRELRADAALAQVPIVVLSRHPEGLEAFRAEILALGAEAALQPEAIDRICEYAPVGRAR